jgi:PEGA domain
MRTGVVAALAVGLMTGIATADEVEDLVARGEAFGKDGEWTKAIDAFKAADVQRPRAKHACLIGLAYTRRELWPQAELFLARCRQRATADDPAPEWVGDAEATLTQKLVGTNAVAVTITAGPPGVLAEVAISSFAPDETFSPRTIHLAPGTYTLRISAPGYTPEAREIQLGTAAAIEVAFVLHRPPTTRHVPPNPIGTALLIGGGVLALGAVGFHVFALRPAHGDLDDAKSQAEYDERLPGFRERRTVAIGLYAGAAATLAVGAILKATVFRGHEVPVEVSATVHDGGAAFALEWRR